MFKKKINKSFRIKKKCNKSHCVKFVCPRIGFQRDKNKKKSYTFFTRTRKIIKPTTGKARTKKKKMPRTRSSGKHFRLHYDFLHSRLILFAYKISIICALQTYAFTYTSEKKPEHDGEKICCENMPWGPNVYVQARFMKFLRDKYSECVWNFASFSRERLSLFILFRPVVFLNRERGTSLL